MTDQPRFSGQSAPTQPRTQVLPQQSWQPAPPPQYPQAQPYGAPHYQAQQGWQAQPQWQAQPWPPHAPQGFPPRVVDPSQPSSEEKNGALAAYLGAFFMPVLLPLVIMLTAANKPFQRAAGLQALITQLGCLAIMMVCPFVMMVLMFSSRSPMAMYLGYVPILMCWVFSVGFGILGMMASQKGAIQYAPLIGRRLAKTFRAEWPAT